ncbi:DNA repair protein RAD51 homolog 4 isoform X5 [Phalacrocorax aristotelis]|uniref:DNA repair protein RAD51 homolog 4 isoform X5 n=1 Tax=Phalacrocorax aristotelis TaxID=126867 RepID=UPI003F4B34D3
MRALPGSSAARRKQEGERAGGRDPGAPRPRVSSPLPALRWVAGAMVVLRAGLCPGLTEEMIQLLRANGIRTVVDFVSSDLEDVSQKCSLSYKALVAVRRVLLAQFSAFPANGADLYEELKSSTAILPTGNRSLDQLLDSGLYTGEVTELMGAPGSGKTQLEALQRIQVVRVFDIYEMLRALQELRDRLSQQVVSSMGPLKIVVIDSVSAVIYPLLGGKQSEGLAIMMQLARELKTLAREFSLAVVTLISLFVLQVTNQVTRDSSAGPLKPALGRSWSFVPSTRVLLESKEATWEKATTQRVASLAKSPRQPTGIQVELDTGNGVVQELSPATPTQGL